MKLFSVSIKKSIGKLPFAGSYIHKTVMGELFKNLPICWQVLKKKLA